jgi:hypothetical protein
MTTVTAPPHFSGLADTEQPREVTLVSKEDARGLATLAPHKLRLLFPSHWRSPYPTGNIYIEAFERCTVDWLNRFDLLKEEHDRETIRKFSCGMYGGYSSPRANFRDGLLVTEFVSLWLFWDDRVVEGGTRWSIDEVLSAMHQDCALRTSDGFMNAWNDLCLRLRQTQSPAWMARLSAEMEDWMRSAKRETDNAQEYRRSGILPEFDEMLELRTVTIGMYPTCYLLELTEGVDLPGSFYDNPIVREIKRLASRLILFGNEFGSLAKDLADGWPNLVTALQRQRNVSAYDAFNDLVDMHNADVDAFDDLERLLPDWGPEIDLQIRGWVQAVRYSVLGFTLWESLAERYQDKKALVSGKVLAAPVTFFDTQ